MNLYVIFAQRHEDYPGQHAPEALEVMDEFGYEENPEWLHEKLAEHQKNNELDSVAIFQVHLKWDAIGIIKGRLKAITKVDGEVRWLV